MSDRIRLLPQSGSNHPAASVNSPLIQQLEQRQQQMMPNNHGSPGGVLGAGAHGARGLREAGRITQQQRENLMNANLWKSYLYELQVQAPIPKRVVCNLDGLIKPSYYGREFHGKLSRDECNKLLVMSKSNSNNNNNNNVPTSNSNSNEDGRYLVRESVRSPGQYTLSLRFNGATKNYHLHYFDGKHFFNEKKFDTLHDLVADALINLYLELHAGDYIASLENQCAYEESPYMTLHKNHIPLVKQKRSLGQHLISSSSSSNSKQATNSGSNSSNESAFKRTSVTSGISPNQSIVSASKHHHNMTNSSSTTSSTSTSSSGQPTNKLGESRPSIQPRTPSHAIASRQLKCSAKGLEALRISIHDDKLIIPGETNNDKILTSSSSQASSSSIEYGIGGNSIDVQLFEKAHSFQMHSFIGFPFCDLCGNFMWGLRYQGVKCDDCGLSFHKKCSDNVPNDCSPDLTHIRRVFGVDLTTLVKACNTVIPFVVEHCIKEIENRGLHVEGLYRVSGFADDVEALKLRLESDGEFGAELALRNCDDVHVITGVLKMYFRLLPLPLITYNCYPDLLKAIKKPTEYEKIHSVKEALAMLPPAHYQTAKYLFSHLVKVSSRSEENLMTPYNLATVFSPTLMKTPNISLMPFQLNAWQVEAEVLEFVIKYYYKLFK